jgi:hypothetical protein
MENLIVFTVWDTTTEATGPDVFSVLDQRLKPSLIISFSLILQILPIVLVLLK